MKKLVFLFSFISIFTTSIFSQIPTEGLVGYWSFSGNADDESGNNHHGTVNGAILTEDRFGNANSAYSFDGVDDYIYITNSSLITGDQLTLSCWVKSEDIDAGWLIITGNQNDYNLGVNGDSITGWIVSGGSGHNLGKSYFYKSEWNNLILKYTGSELQLILNNEIVKSIPASGTISTPQSDHLTFGVYTLSGNPYSGYYKGILDDVRLYNTALTEAEISSIYQENMCSDTIINDTTIYYVSSTEFEAISPKIFHDSTQNLVTAIGGCDSVINFYSKFVFNPTYCSDTTYVTIHDTITTEVFDTTYVTVTDSISVTDTLVIDAVLTGIDPPGNISTLKIYPNPAKDHLFINTGDYTKMDGYQLKIINQLGSVVFETNVEEPLYEVNLSDWTGYGLYFVQVIDSGGSVIDVRKIVLQ